MRFFPKASVRGLTACRFVYMHLLNFLDASPYFEPPSNIITWTAPPQVDGVFVEDLTITSSRVAVHLCCWEGVEDTGTRSPRILVWDWRTGDQVRSLRLEQACSIHFTSSDAQPIRKRECGS